MRQVPLRRLRGRHNRESLVESEAPETEPGESAYDGGGPGKGGVGRIFVNDAKVAEGRVGRTQSHFFSADETTDVGKDDATPVSDDYKERDNSFTGKIQKVVVELGK